MSTNNCPNCGSDVIQSIPGTFGNNDLRMTCLSCKYSYMKPKTKNLANDTVNKSQIKTMSNFKLRKFLLNPLVLLGLLLAFIYSLVHIGYSFKERKESEEWLVQNDSMGRRADSMYKIKEVSDNINKIQESKRSNSFKCNYKILYSDPDCFGGCIDILVSSKLTKDNIIWIVKDVYSKKSIVHLNIAFWNSEKMFKSYWNGGDYKMFAYFNTTQNGLRATNQSRDYTYSLIFKEQSSSGNLSELY